MGKGQMSSYGWGNLGHEAQMTPDLSYQNAAFIPQGETFLPRWQAKAEGFRASLGARARLGLPYGTAERAAFDLFLPEAPPRGLMMFVHGGYWRAFDRSFFSHLAAGAVARGWACAMPSYTLAPAARLGAITAQVASALATAAADYSGPIVVTGHSAGGHLSARMACADAPLAPALAARLARVVPISPVAELEPLIHTTMNAELRIDAATVAAESPARLARRAGTDVTVWVGGAERPAFLWQARTLAESWACPWHVEPGRHHFDVIDDLALPGSPLMQTLLGGL